MMRRRTGAGRTAGLGWRVCLSAWTFIVVTALVLLAAWNTGANLLYIVLGGLLSFLTVSSFMAWLTLRRCTVTLSAPEAVHRGEAVLFHLRANNPKRWVPALALRAAVAEEPALPVARFVNVPPQGAAEATFERSYEKRGAYPLPDIVLATRFPFGLFEYRRVHTQPGELLVYPKVRSVRIGALDQLPGAADVTLRTGGDGTEFFALREYVVGDDIRHISWRASARTGVWMVREMAQESARFIVFVLDTNRVPDLDDFEAQFEDAVDLVASLAVALLQQQFGVSVVTPEHTVPVGEGAAHIHHVLEFLARVTIAERTTPFELRQEESTRARHVFISADPRRWGHTVSHGRFRVLDPREVIRA